MRSVLPSHKAADSLQTSKPAKTPVPQTTPPFRSDQSGASVIGRAHSCSFTSSESEKRTPGTTPKPEIRKVLREMIDEAGNLPNMNRAWDVLKVLLLEARRSRVREVLKEDEFASRRRGPGRRAKPRQTQPTTAQKTPVAI